ncbi:hypothetical protein BH10BAC2_BH10BAC2_46400 [soil metagenome]
MIEKISWASYATTLLTVVVIYYIVIALLYYRREISLIVKLLQKRFRVKADLNPKVPGTDKNTISSVIDTNPEVLEEPSHNGDISTDAFDLVEKIKDAILQYAERQYIKEEIITGLHLLLKEYLRLQYSAYTGSINNIIIKEIETHCSIRLEDEEVKRLWK